jgi:two-component system response regulator FixJ
MQNLEPIIFLVDDDLAVLESLSLLLRSVGLNVRSYSSAKVFWEEYQPGQIACLVLDIRMPGMSGLVLQQTLIDNQVMIPIIFITGHGDVSMAVKAMKAGAFDFVQKPIHDQTLLDSIEKAIQQNIKASHDEIRALEMQELISTLTDRERDVLKLILAGLPNKSIARQLDLSTRTVEAHRASIFEKLQVKSLVQLVHRCGPGVLGDKHHGD